MELLLEERHEGKDSGVCYRTFIGDSDTTSKEVIQANEVRADLVKGKTLLINGRTCKVIDARVGSYCNLINRRLYFEVLVNEEPES